jgi:16S rRNA C1402 N4-methylase RsmH
MRIANVIVTHVCFYPPTILNYLGNFLRYFGVEKVDGILADLGVSSHDFDEATAVFRFVLMPTWICE